ncbi:MAG: DUF2889 domain-containing protein [Acidobacteria bacterium]|nr:DUF2889 domain-containing protein [Acidobacteriota bacterium]
MTKIDLSINLPENRYLRTFEAEIDVITGNELLVRGRMQDHRFDLEHVWMVRTPEYAVIEARAQQSSGDITEFHPELCARYPAIGGVLIGRGFSKRIIEELGDLPGRQEHLWLAIEMARVGQQVYQYSPEFEARFPQVADRESEAAHVAWMKDRAYMPGLSNSCYTYRDESAELFKSRPVRCGFGPEIFKSKPGNKSAFRRNKQLAIIKNASQDGTVVYSCQSRMEDSIHDIEINFDVAAEGLISNARSRGLRLPYHGICEDPHLRTAGLNGLQLTGAYVRQFAEQVGRSNGCTHLFDLSIDVLRLFTFT